MTAGAPGPVPDAVLAGGAVRVTMLGERPGWRVETAQASAEVSAYGGQVLAWRPSDQTEDVFWQTSQPRSAPAPLRGGVPVCWPWFGRREDAPDLPAHGVVRTQAWRLTDARIETDGVVAMTLVPEGGAVDGLELTQELRIGRTFEQTLVSENLGEVPLLLTQALHSYFHVGDALAAEVDGLDGHDYLDKFEHYAALRRQRGPWSLYDPRDPGRSDRIYVDAPGRYALRDPAFGRTLRLTSAGSRSLVVWNPGEAGGRAMDDVGDGWRAFVCVEVANAGTDRVTLAPGTSHRLSQRIEVLPGTM